MLCYNYKIYKFNILLKRIFNNSITIILVLSGSAVVLANILVLNFTQSSISIQQGMEIFKYEVQTEETLTGVADFNGQTISQDQFEVGQPDLEAVAAADDYLILNHYGDNPPDTSEVDWWDDDADSSTKYNWRYRKCFSLDLTNPSATSLSEYQIYLDFDTQTPISEGKMLTDGADIRFVDSSNNIIDYYIADDIDTNSTRIWIQPDSIPAGQVTEICMYYGYVPYLENPIPINLPTDLSDRESVFTYSSLRDIYYTISDAISNTVTNFASYFDGVQIVVDTFNDTLNEFESEIFPTLGNLEQTTAFQTTSAINATFQDDPTDALVPAAAAGTEFVYFMDRNTNEFSFISPYCNSDVEVRNSNLNIVTGGSFTITQGDFFNLTTNNNAITGLPNNDVVIIESTNNCPFYAYHHTDGATDNFPMWPASNEWYGVGSSNAFIGVLQDGTNVDIFRSDGTTTATTLNRGQGTTFGGGGQGTSFSHRVSADQPIGVKQLADGDGIDATTFMPILEMGYKYFIPDAAEYVTISAIEGESGDIDLYNDGTSCEVGAPNSTQSITGTNDLPGFARFTNTLAGACIVSEIPIAVYYEKDSSNDEKNAWSRKQNRQYVDQYPSDVQSNTEQGLWDLGSITHEWTRRIQVTVTNNSSATIEEFQYPIDLSSTDIFTLAQADGGDIRVAGSLGDGTDDEDYFLDLYSSSDSRGTVWIQIDSLVASASQDYYIYFKAIDSFDTSSIGPDIWLDGQDIDGDGTTGNNPTGNLSIWEDISGNNNDATQATVGRQPVINGNIVEFTGDAAANSNGEFLNIPNLDLQTFFIVFDNVRDSATFFGGGLHAVVGVDGGIYKFLSTDELGYQVSFDGQTTEQGQFTLNDGPIAGPGENVGVGNFPGGQQVYWGQYTNSQSGWDFIGALDFFGVNAGYNPTYDIKEFIALDGTVTAGQRSDLSAYLEDKWSDTESTSTLSTTGNIDSIFTTTNLRTTYYVVDIENTTNNVDIYSFEDGNQVSDSVTTITIDEGEFETFPSDNGLDQNDIFSVTGPLSINFTEDTTDSALPIGWLGTEFVYNNERNSDVFSLLSPYKNATVQIQASSTGTWTTVQTVNLTAGIPDSTAINIVDSGSFKILSDQPILATHRNDTVDSKVLYPTDQAFEESTGEYILFGVASGNLTLAAANTGTTNATIYRSDNTSTPVVLNSANNYSYAEVGAAQGDANAIRIVADGPIGATSYADADGGETAVFLPKKEFSNLYILPAPTQYISIATDDPSVTCRIFDETGVEINTGPATLDSLPPQTSGALVSPFPNQVFIGGNDTGDGAFFFAGSSLRCSEPVYAFFEHHIDSTITDETTLLTHPQVRQRAEIEPVVDDLDSSDEQGLYFESGFDSATTGLDPEAEFEWIIDVSSLTNSEHIFWNEIDFTEIISDRTDENSVDGVSVEVAYADPTPSCALATYTTASTTEANITNISDPSPPFSTNQENLNRIQIPDEASDSECLRVRVNLRTGDEAYSPRLEDITSKYILPNILEDQLNSPTVSISGSATDDRVRVIKVTNPNSGLAASTCELRYNSVSSAAPFVNADFEFFENQNNILNPQFNFPPFPGSSTLSGSSSICDPNNDLSLYFQHERTTGITESIDLSVEQNIGNLSGPLSTRDFTLQVLNP